MSEQFLFQTLSTALWRYGPSGPNGYFKDGYVAWILLVIWVVKPPSKSALDNFVGLTSCSCNQINLWLSLVWIWAFGIDNWQAFSFKIASHYTTYIVFNRIIIIIIIAVWQTFSLFNPWTRLREKCLPQIPIHFFRITSIWLALFPPSPPRKIRRPAFHHKFCCSTNPEKPPGWPFFQWLFETKGFAIWAGNLKSSFRSLCWRLLFSADVSWSTQPGYLWRRLSPAQ